MVATRDISIRKGGGEIARETLELLRLPDDATGAKWGGLVFPLRDGDWIEVGDPGVVPGDCSPLEGQPTPWSLARSPHDGEAYLFVEGTVQACRQAERRLAQAGFEVLRSGPNLSGGTGDWFIRLGAMPDDSVGKLTDILRDVRTTMAVGEETSSRERLLVQALVAAQASQARLRAQLEQARAVVSVPASDETPELRSLRESLGTLSVRFAEVEAEATALRERLESTPRPAPGSKANKLEGQLAVAAVGLLPRLEFIGSSMRFIAVELPERAILWKALAALDRQERGLPPGWKSLSGHEGWWERHFSTGQDNQGRLYARFATVTARWQVLVSHKQDQTMDLRRIGRM